MASVVGWLDYSEDDRQKMREVIDLFKEQDSIDELGLRAIRDPLANMMFPGVSTIQTRARYFIFVPWVYRRIEDLKVPSSRAADRSRDLQYDLVKSMKAGGAEAGQNIIGWEAGRNVRRLPDEVYWTGLKTFGIRLFNGSIRDYHRSLDSYYERLHAFTKGDGDEISETFRPNWTAHLPAPPKDLWEKTTIELTEEEARFLYEQIVLHCSDTLLAHLIANPIDEIGAISTPWDHPALSSAPEAIRVTVEHARLFAVVTEGAAFAYNLMLAEKAKARGLDVADNNLDERYTQRLASWAADMATDGDVARWDTEAFWEQLTREGARIPRGAHEFAQSWILATQQAPERIVAMPSDIRALIEDRERRLKKGRARLQVHRALEMWSGESGLGLQTYGWPNARTLLADIHRGLGRA